MTQAYVKVGIPKQAGRQTAVEVMARQHDDHWICIEVFQSDDEQVAMRDAEEFAARLELNADERAHYIDMALD